jgi:indolepyruvate ferredoxin oxidoreductase alpha subunit
MLRGVIGGACAVKGRLDGSIPRAGELDPNSVARALSLISRPTTHVPSEIVPRPPTLCPGCPHANMFDTLRDAIQDHPGARVFSDIGCYTLGALPPYTAIDTCVCMGASVGMAKGAADAGFHPVVAVIGDSTFLHSGTTPLLDAVTANTPMTLVILDNKTVGMTGGQPTIRPSSELEGLVRGLGVPEAHLHVLEAHPRNVAANTEVLRREVDHHGLSVIIAVRECIETAKRSKQERATTSG